MKKNRFLLMLFTVAIALLGVQCSDDDGISADEMGSLTLSSTSFNVVVAGGEETLTFACDDEWSIALAATEESTTTNWVGFSAVSGEGDAEVALTIFENTTSSTRSLTFTVTAGDATSEDAITADFTVSQAAGDISISVSESRPMALLSHVASTIVATDEDADETVDTNTATFNVVCNDPDGWVLSIPEEDTWLTTLIVGNKITFYVAEYEDETATEARRSVVTLSCDSDSSISCEITIVQNSIMLDYPPTLEVTEPAGVTGDGGTATIAVTAENLTTEWTAEVVAVNEGEDVSWLTITDGASGEESGDITIAFEKYLATETEMRSAYVVVSTLGVEDVVVTVIQESSLPSVAVAESAAGVAVAGTSATATLTVTANTDWTATVSAEDSTYGSGWFSITAQSVADGTISIKADDWYTSDGTETRTATVKVSYTGDYSSMDAIEVTVTQTAQMVADATYTITNNGDNTLSLAVTNTSFVAGQTFTASDYTLSYTNDYSSSASQSGTLAISSVALSDSSNATLIITTSDSIYNTDDLKFYMSGTTDSSIVFASGATFDNLGSDAALTIASNYVEYVDCDFETEDSYSEWSVTQGDVTTAMDNHVFGKECTADGTTGNKTLYFKSDGTNMPYILSKTFAYDPADGDSFTLTFRTLAPIGTNYTAGGYSNTFCTKSSTATMASWSPWVGGSNGSGGQSLWVNVVSSDDSRDQWISHTYTFTDLAQPTDSEDYDDLRYVGRFGAGVGELYFDDFKFGNAKARTEAGTGN